MKKTLESSFKETIGNELIELSSDIGELSLDSFLDDGLFKDIPFVKNVISTFKLASNISKAVYVRNLFVFLQTIQNGTVTSKEREKHKNHFKKAKTIKKELDYVLIYCNRLIETESVKYFGKLYLALLNERISFNEFIKFSAILEKLLPGDVEFLFSNGYCSMQINFIDDHFLRLVGTGLMKSITGRSVGPKFGYRVDIHEDSNYLTFIRTDFGNEFLSALDLEFI